MRSKLLGVVVALAVGSSAAALDGPNLVVTRLDVPAVVNKAEPATYVATVKNIGNVATNSPGGVYVVVYFSSDATITPDDPAWASGWFSDFAPGQEKTVAMNVPAGGGSGPGVFWAGAIVDGPDGYGGARVPETNEDDNTLLGTQITVTQSDLAVTGMAGPTSIQAGETVTVTAHLKNLGDGRTSGPIGASGFYLAAYVTGDANITECDDAGFDCDLQRALVWVDTMAPGEERDVVLTFSSTIPGYIGLLADTGENPAKGTFVYERDESNNALVPAFTAVGPDLVVTRLEVPAVVNKAEPATYVATVKNIGNVATNSPGGVYVVVYFSSDATITADDPAWASGWFSDFAPGQEKTVTMNVPAGGGSGPGTFWAGAIVDGPDGYGGERIPETNERNNTLLGSRVTVTQSDVAVTGMAGPTTIQAGETVTVTAHLKNLGDGRTSGPIGASGFYLAAYVTGDAQITECDDAGFDCDLQVALAWVEVMAPGEERDVALTFSSTVPGYVGLLADTAENPQKGTFVYERDESNNVLVPALIAP
ncbi:MULTISPECIES: CARDB domain-containing protein [Anaeromyxobacter]|uniref:CARDB domain-containing protein n=1 Tax=Anaeromyxobacter TaxID=161492 RepID=UPI001F56DDF9|nr:MULTISPECIES: CARDB domain-containing protein [unclassified Anaeromyxobacter]